ncbi:MAG: LysR substrate-binding domain-containing protein [Coxiellaceae bacterium]|nr:LysR substrate-binding domain-containing protein [Coxiellaceae bacterium]
MTLTELRYITALAQTKHFGQAAKLCHVSQPTLSVAINKLEKSLKTSLFERRPNEVRITDIGERIIQQAQRVLEEAEKIEQLASVDQSHIQTPLKVGAIYTIAPYLFPLLIPQIKRAAPKMTLIIQENYTAVLREKLQTGELDAIFIALPFSEPGVVVKPLYDETFVALMPKKHPLAEYDKIKANQLNKQNVLLLGEGHCFRDQILEACPQCYHTTEQQQTIEGSSLETLRAMVASGYGITILPSSATQVKHYSNTLTTRPFTGKQPQRTVALAWRDSFPRTKAITVLIQALTKSTLNGVCLIN